MDQVTIPVAHPTNTTMQPKKVPAADLEKRRPGFLAIGLLTALAASLVAFEWTTHHRGSLAASVIDDVGIEEEIAPPSAHPPPPAPPPLIRPERLEIVDNHEEVPETPAPDSEITEVDPVLPALLPNEMEVEPELPFRVVEDMPEFPGGDEALMKYLQRNLSYPEMASRTGTQGTVYVNFEVDKQGWIKDVTVLRGIGGGCDEEAIRVVKAMPQWTPGMQRGKAVRVLITLPVKFKLI